MSENNQDRELRPEELEKITGGVDLTGISVTRRGGRTKPSGVSFSLEALDAATERKPEERTGELQPHAMP